MTLPNQPAPQRAEGIIRAAFWTLFVLTVAATAYWFAVVSFGKGLFLSDQHVPKLHMRGEARLANILATEAAIGLAVVCVFIGRWSRPLRLLGFAALAFWIFHLAVPG